MILLKAANDADGRVDPASSRIIYSIHSMHVDCSRNAQCQLEAANCSGADFSVPIYKNEQSASDYFQSWQSSFPFANAFTTLGQLFKPLSLSLFISRPACPNYLLNQYQSIIIMSDHQDQLPPQNNVSSLEASLIRHSAPATPPTTDNREQHQKSAQIQTCRENHKTVDWKKEIKHFFKTLRKNGCFNYCDGKQPWLVYALRMLDFGSKPKISQNSKDPLPKGKIQRKQDLKSKTICLVNKPLRPESFLVLLLSYRYMTSSQQQFYFDVELLSKSSRTIYKKINLRKWQQVHAEIKEAKSRTPHLVLKLQNKEAITNHLYKNKQFLNLLQPFQELSACSFKKEQLSIQQDVCELQDNREIQLIYQVIDRFQFIRGALLQHFQKDSYAFLNIHQTIAITIAHSIVNLLPVSHHRHLAPQMRPYFAAVIRNLNREHVKQQRRIKSVTLNQDHFPVHLENAQNCWRCKKKRGYICCSTCSRNQGKNISLCLNCYANHHSELNNSVISHSEQEANAIFEQWSALNEGVQTMMAQIKLTNTLKIEDFA